MRVWTDGKRHIYLGDEALYILDPDATRRLEEFAMSEGERGVLGVSPAGDIVWLRDEEDQAVRVNLKSDNVTSYPWKVHAVEPIGETDVLAAYTTEADDELELGLGAPPEDRDARWDEEIDIPEPTRVQWPSGVIFEEGEEPWGEQDRPGFAYGIGPDDIHATSSFFGTAITDCATGIITVYQPRDEQIVAVLQVPTSHPQPATSIDAVPTSKGVLVSLSIEGQESALLHFDNDGNCLNSRAFWGLGPVALLDAGQVLTLAHSEYGGDELQAMIIELGTMAEVDTFPILFDGMPQQVDVFVDAERRHFIVGGPHVAQLGHREKVGWSIEPDNVLEREVEVSEEEEPNYVPEQATGEPAINFPVIEEAPESWDFDEGDEVELDFKVRSSGEAGRGLKVRVSGAAIEAGLFEPQTFVAGGAEGEFEREDSDVWIARLPDARLPQGLVYPLDPKPKKKVREYAHGLLADTHLDVAIQGRAAEVGSELLRIEVASLHQELPIKWMRPFSVE